MLKLLRWGVECDVSCNNFLPLINTRLLRKYASLAPVCVELARAVKHWAKQRQLLGARGGNLSSYAFTLMAVYFCQVRGVLPRLRPTGELWADPVSGREYDADFALSEDWRVPEYHGIQLLADFFGFFGSARDVGGFAWGDEVVSVRRGARAHFNAYPCLRGDNVLLNIEDPIETTRNLSDVLRAGRGAALQEAMRETSAKGVESLR